MPYCYVEDMSIVAVLRASVKALSSRGGLSWSKQCGVFLGILCVCVRMGEGGCVHVATFFFCCCCFFGGINSVPCDSQQVGDTCEKSFTNNSSRFVRVSGA